MTRALTVAIVIALAIIMNSYGDLVKSDSKNSTVIEATQKSFWTLGNQLKKEERPYTTPEEVDGNLRLSFRSTISKLLSPQLRSMQRLCDGQCFYAPKDCNISDYRCPLIASVAAHNEDKEGIMYCDYFGKDNLRESFCYNSEAQKRKRDADAINPTLYGKKNDKFYTITLHRALGPRIKQDPPLAPSSSCPKRWNHKTGRRCRRTEFVAISFGKAAVSSGSKLSPDDLWYVCIMDEPQRSRVSMWTQISEGNATGDKKPIQIVGTKPHIESGMGVVFSKIMWDEDIVSMGCQFVIQESNMTLDSPPENAAFFGNTGAGPITVKLASGYVKRDEDKDDVVQQPFYEAAGENFSYYDVYTGNDIKPTNQINFDKLEVIFKNATPDYETAVKRENVSATIIQETIDKCQNPKSAEDYLIACYPPSTEENCIHTKRCPVLFIVEVKKPDLSFNHMKGYLYSKLPDTKYLRKGRRPMGWASVAFSKDNMMGRDVVISCHSDGPDPLDMDAYVSINYFHSNIYPGKISYNHLIYNIQKFASATDGTILCSWEMKTAFTVNMFEYEPAYRHAILLGETEKLEFNFSNERVHLLLATGNRNYPKGVIVKHDFAQTLDPLFSKELFFKRAAGCLNHNSVLITSFMLIVLFVFY